MGFGQLLTMPLFFASNAIYPVSMMPGWLQAISHVNPLTYEVDALRTLMLSTGGTGTFSLVVDFGVVTLVTAALIVIAARLYPRVVI
jgi:ABC-2 type transport system permease protein